VIFIFKILYQGWFALPVCHFNAIHKVALARPAFRLPVLLRCDDESFPQQSAVGKRITYKAVRRPPSMNKR
jgi:hypothetical protein